MIGVYGGTFNPVHYGHLRTALEVSEAFALDEIRLIPCRLPPHRRQPQASAELRLRMLQLALSGVPGMRADRRELDREGPSYMVDTLRSLRRELADQSILLFLGVDAFAKLKTWHQWRQLFDYAHIVVMTRPGHRHDELDDFFDRRLVERPALLRKQQAGYLYFQHVTQLDISATAIRELIALNKDPRFLLPDSVIAYITEHKLYRG
ncbi:nicotinate-nucleotide adenylyltransferase [Methylomarinum sp. Ch1-1]|uniref:Probable nicotinate-nucleotide adenylyltransferase n=1 Tax=Methylomarinum roseum TaxID=3067653 RepID=A0AAU7NSD6_9GAMM|nr:nicotinate-nucleotide adenylyltransferase [Methylomarinum sp. Ch1-1]MDP4520100.1 nicotinate-nucleotide adenylyltransferase [Methylomarinum sp. Ch1-1]